MNWIELKIERPKNRLLHPEVFHVLCSVFSPLDFPLKRKKGKKDKEKCKKLPSWGSRLSIMLIYNGNWTDCKAIWSEIIRVTSGYHGNMISWSQHSFLTETAIFIVERWENASANVLLLSTIMVRKVIHVNFVFFSAIFAGPRSVEIQKFCYHGNVTQRCHGIKMCLYVCLRQLPSFSCQIIKGPHFYSAATTAETLFMSESHSVINGKWKTSGAR